MSQQVLPVFIPSVFFKRTDSSLLGSGVIFYSFAFSILLTARFEVTFTYVCSLFIFIVLESLTFDNCYVQFIYCLGAINNSTLNLLFYAHVYIWCIYIFGNTDLEYMYIFQGRQFSKLLFTPIHTFRALSSYQQLILVCTQCQFMFLMLYFPYVQ